MNIKKILIAMSVVFVLLLSSCDTLLSSEYDVSKSTKSLDDTATQQVISNSASVLKSIENRDIRTLYKVYDGTITKNANILLIAPGGPQFGD